MSALSEVLLFHFFSKEICFFKTIRTALLGDPSYFLAVTAASPNLQTAKYSLTLTASARPGPVHSIPFSSSDYSYFFLSKTGGRLIYFLTF